MAKQDERVARLRQKYGAKAMDSAAKLHPHEFPELVEWRDELDPHYTKLWLDFTYGGMFNRGVLDERTRFLVLIAQFVVLDEMEELGSHLRSALNHGVSPREALEVILQATVYVGYPKVKRAARVFREILVELGRMDEITKTQLPLEGNRAGRSLEQERATWSVSDEEFPRREELMKKYGWEGISTGLRLQPHHVHTVQRTDRVDQHFLKLWLDFIYAGMYTRGILDDKTRILCVVGELVVLDEMAQGENHIRNALAHGATPREILEVMLQATVYVGMPRFVRIMGVLVRILEEDGRMAELIDTQLPLPEQGAS